MKRLKQNGVDFSGEFAAQLTWPVNFFFADRTYHLHRTLSLGLVRSRTCRELIKYAAEGINIRSCRDRLATGLFGTGIFRSKDSSGRVLRTYRDFAQDLGNSEIQELRDALLGYQNVVGLQIAVNNQFLMGKMQGVAKRQKQSQTVSEGKMMPLAIAIERQTVDIFHDEIGQSILGYVRIENASNIWVLQT